MNFSELDLIRGQCGHEWMAQTTDSDQRDGFARTSIAFSSDLLQRMMMVRGCEHDQVEKIDEDMELNLGLSLGRGFHGNKAKKEKEIPCGDPDMKKKNSENGAENFGLQRNDDGSFNFGLEMKNQDLMVEEGVVHNQKQEMLEHQKKRELHALRRQKARKKREEKQLQRAKKEGVVRSSIHHPNKMRNGFVHVPPSCVPFPIRGFGPREEDKRVLETQMSSHREKDRAAKENQCHQNQNQNQPRSDKRDKVCDHGGISCIEDKSSRTSNEIEVMVSSSNCVEPPTSNEISSTSHPSFPILPMPYPFPLLAGSPQPMPLPMGFPFPYMMPYWAPSTGPETSKGASIIPPLSSNVLQPVVTRPFPLFQMPVSGTTPPSWVADSQARPLTGPVQSSHASGASSGRSSSAVSDYESGSSQGTSSNDTKSQSSTSSASKPLHRVSSLSNTQEQTVGSSELSASSQLEPPKSTEAALEKAPSVTAQSALATSTTTATHERQLTEASSSTKSSQQVSASNATTDKTSDPKISEDKRPLTQSSLPKMPCVSTTGPSPNGKTISGFLYSYSRDEVSIVCVCHGTFLSPAEFVQHSGRTDLSHPERHIVVNPSPSANQDASALE